MAYDRYTCICQPIKSCSWTFERASLGILVAWALAAIISSPQLYIFKVELITMNAIQFETCYVKWNRPFFEGCYIFFHAMCQFFLPFVLLLFFYLSIFLAVSNSINVKKASFEAAKEYYDISPSRNSSLKYKNDAKTCAEQDSFTKSTFKRSLKNVMLELCSKSSKTKQIKTFYQEETNLIEMNSIILDKSTNEEPKLIKNLQDEAHRSTRLNLNIFKKNNSFPIRQNVPVTKVLSKSKMKTLKLTITVVIAYVMCSLPFYSATLIQFFFGPDIKKYPMWCKDFFNSTFKLLCFD